MSYLKTFAEYFSISISFACFISWLFFVMIFGDLSTSLAWAWAYYVIPLGIWVGFTPALFIGLFFTVLKYLKESENESRE